MNIEAKNLNLAIDGIQILKGISFSITDGSFTCLVGPNGSGKSSLLRTIVKDVTTYFGFITDIEENQMTYIPQVIGIPPFLNTFELVNLGFYGQKLKKGDQDTSANELLDICGINHIKYQAFTDVSAGERQRGWLAFALAQEKELILMDEPLASIDLPARRNFFKLLRSVVEEGKTLVLVTHDTNLAVEYSDHIIALSKGKKVFDGSPTEYHSLLSGDLS